MIARLLSVLAVAALATACGTPLMTLPTGPGTPATDGAEAFAQATTACRAARTFSAEVGLSGKVGGRRARGRLLAGVAAPASVYLDAPAPFGASVFVFAAVGDDATVLLPRDRRVLERGRPVDVLEAVTGVPLAPPDVRDALTGCTTDADGSGAEQLGDGWRVIPGASTVYLRRETAAGPWRLVAVVHRPQGRPEWRAYYSEFVADLPRSVRLVSADPSRFDLRLALSQVEVNVPLEESVFHPAIPSGYSAISLDELRSVGPLAESSSR